jgi:hypothetical protein
MAEAVIISTAHTPIRRAYRGAFSQRRAAAGQRNGRRRGRRRDDSDETGPRGAPPRAIVPEHPEDPRQPRGRYATVLARGGRR